jgi:O-antigen/teichoic acid export membrane protein
VAADNVALHNEESLAHRAMKSSIWITFGFGSSLVLRLLSSIVLTRFIHPDTYGLMDLVTTLMVLLHLFSDIGLVPCIVQSPRGDDPRMLNTLWTLTVLRSIILAVFASAIAIPVARFYGRPILGWIIPAVALTGIVEGLASPGYFSLLRHLKRGRIVAIEFTNTLVSFIATIVAVYGWNPDGFRAVLSRQLSNLPFDESLTWTVVIGGLVARIVATAMTYALIPGIRPRFELERQSVREVFGFGRWVLLSSATSFMAQQGDRFIAPKISNFEANGLYGRALGLLNMATGLVEGLAGSIVFPTISRIREKNEDVTGAIEQVTRTLGLFGSILLSGMFVAGASLVHVIYPETYSAVAWILQSLVIVGWFQFRAGIASSIMLGLGKPSGPTFGSVAKMVTVLGLAAPAVFLVRRTQAHPLLAIIGVVGLGEIFRYLVMLYLMKKAKVWHVMTELKAHGAMALLTGISAYLGGQVTLQVLGHAPITKMDWFVSALIGGNFVVFLWGAVGAVLWRQGKIRLPRKHAEPVAA